MKKVFVSLLLKLIKFFAYNFLSGGKSENTISFSIKIKEFSPRVFTYVSAGMFVKPFFILKSSPAATFQKALRCLIVVKRIIMQGATVPPGLSKSCMNLEMCNNMYSMGLSRGLLNIAIDFLYLIKDCLSCTRGRAAEKGVCS